MGGAAVLKVSEKCTGFYKQGFIMASGGFSVQVFTAHIPLSLGWRVSNENKRL